MVDATNAPIHAGDLLSTSDRPGYAMKAVPDVINGHQYYSDGTVLGKAMGTLECGTGTIEVLGTLQQEIRKYKAIVGSTRIRQKEYPHQENQTTITF